MPHYIEPSVQRSMERIRAEYLEMPGMSLTLDQIVRLCGLDRSVGRKVLDALVDARFLWRRPDGAYALLTAETGRMRMEAADLPAYVAPRVRRRAS